MEFHTTYGTLDHSPSLLQLFDGLPDAELKPLLAACAVARVAAGSTVVDGRGARLYILLSGALQVSQADLTGSGLDSGRAKLMPGECAGELSVLDEGAPASTLHALQDSDLLVIEAELLWRLIDHSNGVARNLLRLLSFRVRAANAQLRQRHKLGEFYRQLSLVDGLTGLQNRAWLDEHLPQLVTNAAAAGNPLSVVMVDIDHFKKFNDDYGHQAGDDVLRTAAKVLSGALRPRDVAARYGGEEMTVVLPNTHCQAALGVAERLCESLRRTVFFSDMHKPLPHITASFGVACLAPGQDADALVAAADAALYRAKHAGRNQVAL